MKLPKGVTIRHQGQTYRKEIPDKFAYLIPGHNQAKTESSKKANEKAK